MSLILWDTINKAFITYFIDQKLLVAQEYAAAVRARHPHMQVKKLETI